MSECVHKYEDFDWETICVKCGLCYENSEYKDEYINMEDKQNNHFKYKDRYDRIDYEQNLLDLYNGKVNGKYIRNYYIREKQMIKNLPDPCNWEEIYNLYNKMFIPELYLTFAYKVNLKLNVSLNCLRIVRYINSNMEFYIKIFGWKIKANLNFWYVVYKIMQMYDREDINNVPLKISQLILNKYESKFKLICEYENYKFIPFPLENYNHITAKGKIKIKKRFKLPKVHWNKKEKFASLKIHRNDLKMESIDRYIKKKQKEIERKFKENLLFDITS